MTKAKLADVRDRFGSDWPITRIVEDTLEMALATLPKLKKKFEEPGKFLMIQAEEITDKYDGNPIHVNATNLLELIPPQGGNSFLDVLQRNIDAVNKQREETGQVMIAHVNHPNFGWGIVAENLIELGEILEGTKLGRTGPNQITVADLTGVAIQDLVIAEAVYRAKISD